MNLDDKYFKECYLLYEQAQLLEKNSEVEKALEIYLSILDNYKPIGMSYYERPAIILEKLKRYNEALDVCDLVFKNINIFTGPTKKTVKDMFTKRKERLIKKINPPTKTKNITTIKKKPTKEIISISTSVCKEIIYPNWYISISFASSKSSNFVQALAIARLAPQFIENVVEGNTLYQSVYSDKPEEYLQFIKLYELISQWKSCFVVINGQLIDRKIVGGLNYCYGDKCRSGKPDFCFGASELTKNPFGCHRLQISSHNNPWWSHGAFDTKSIFHIDKNAIKERIFTYSLPYRNCPCFSMEKINIALNNIPDTINPKKDKNWTYVYNGVQPINLFNAGSISMNLSTLNINSNETDNIINKETLLSKIFSVFRK